MVSQSFVWGQPPPPSHDWVERGEEQEEKEDNGEDEEFYAEEASFGEKVSREVVKEVRRVTKLRKIHTIKATRSDSQKYSYRRLWKEDERGGETKRWSD